MISARILGCVALAMALAVPAARAQPRADVTIYAAASLRDALDELAREYER